MPGVKGMITMDDLPAPADSVTDLGVVIKANTRGERGLAMEPVYQGEPILAVAAVDELTAADAIEKIKVTFEPLPFVVDPFVSLRPGGPNARTDGNTWMRQPAPPPAPGAKPAPPPPLDVVEIKWTEEISRITPKARCRWASRPTSGRMAIWMAASRTRRSFSTKLSDAKHQPPVSGDAHRHGLLAGRQAVHPCGHAKHGADDSGHRPLDEHEAPMTSSSSANIPAADSEARSPRPFTLIIPAILSKKCNAPVMMRISREEEHYIGRGRPSLTGRIKVGFAKDGRHHRD